MPAKIKVALVTFYPAIAVLREKDVKPAYRSKEHPAPWVNALSRGLAGSSDVELHVFVHSRAVTKVCRGTVNGVNFTFIPKREPLRSDPFHFYYPGTIALRSHIEAFDPDIVHGFGAEAGHGLLASRMGRPSVFFIQGITEKIMPQLNRSALFIRLQRTIEDASVRSATAIVAETNFAKNWALTVKPEALVHVIPHALNPSFLSVDPDFTEKRILCVSRIDRTKGSDIVVRAFIDASRRVPDARFDLIGDGGLRDELQESVLAAGLSHSIRFAGTQNHEQIMSAMKNACAAVIGSRMDTSPNVVTEAHAAGLPVVGTNAGGIPEMIDHEKDGFVVPVENPAAMADRVEHLLNNLDTCRAMGSAGRNKVLVLNDPQRVAEQHVKLYREVLSGKTGGTRK